MECWSSKERGRISIVAAEDLHEVDGLARILLKVLAGAPKCSGMRRRQWRLHALQLVVDSDREDGANGQRKIDGRECPQHFRSLAVTVPDLREFNVVIFADDSPAKPANDTIVEMWFGWRNAGLVIEATRQPNGMCLLQKSIFNCTKEPCIGTLAFGNLLESFYKPVRIAKPDKQTIINDAHTNTAPKGGSIYHDSRGMREKSTSEVRFPFIGTP